LTRGSDNIDIGNTGVAGDGGKIKIGTPGNQTETFIAGISTARITGAAVYVTASGQLGVLASSERYKTEIATMDAQTQKLSELRPVSFHLKSEPNGAVQYGLIAEEVDKVYPELVIRDEKGVIQGVRYDELAPMLLNVVQRQDAKIAADELTIKAQAEHAAAQDAHAVAQDATIQAQSDRIAEVSAQSALLMAELERVNLQVQAALAQIHSRDAQVAMR
jgi:hypothetical protein